MTRAPLLLALTLIALPLSAALSPQHVAWREGPARFIMSPDEIESWNAVTTDA